MSEVNQVADDSQQDEPEVIATAGIEETAKEVVESSSEESDEEGEELVVTIKGESPPPDEEESGQAPEWVKTVRKNNRELHREVRELREQLKTQAVENKPTPVGKKPTLEDVDYDTEKFEQQLTAWHDAKRAESEAANKRQAEEKVQQDAWQSKLDGYKTAKAGLKVRSDDFEDAESAVQEILSATQQGIILQGAKNPALFIYAIGKNPKKAKELAELKDPVLFAVAVGEFETKIDVKTKKTAPAPEKTVQGTARVSGASYEKTLERLRDEALKSGKNDLTAVIEYKRKHRESANRK